MKKGLNYSDDAAFFHYLCQLYDAGAYKDMSEVEKSTYIELLKKDEDDERRDKRRCLFFTQNKCSYSSYTWETSLEGGDLCRPDFTRKVTVSKHVIRSAKKKRSGYV